MKRIRLFLYAFITTVLIAGALMMGCSEKEASTVVGNSTEYCLRENDACGNTAKTLLESYDCIGGKCVVKPTTTTKAATTTTTTKAATTTTKAATTTTTADRSLAALAAGFQR